MGQFIDDTPFDNDPSTPLSVQRWPQAIMHLDADAFFASCEQAMHPALKGKPVITGKERGIVAAASYEAKALGIKRGMRLHEVQSICPHAVILPSDYESYSLFSVRLFDILRRYSPEVEEYSIDEGFVDLTGLRQQYHCSYAKIAAKVKKTVETELGLNVSIGVSLSKVLAKIGSKFAKPDGVIAIEGREIHKYLDLVPAHKVWGIGSNTAAYLRKLKINTALELARRPEWFIKKHFAKPIHDIWSELNGWPVYELELEPKTQYQSISKTKTFTPASANESFVFAQLTKNLENACIKARRYSLAAQRVTVFLRTQDYQDCSLQLHLTRPTAYPPEIMSLLREGFCRLFQQQTLYRTTGVILSHLMTAKEVQLGLFDDPVRIEKMTNLHSAIDHLSKRFGKHTVLLGASLPTKLQAQHEGERGDVPWRKNALFPGENSRQRLGLLVLDVEV